MLLETSIKFKDEVNELKKEFIKEIATDVMDMDETGFILMKKLFGLLDTSVDLMHEQAKTIDLIDKKLDRLFEKEEA